MCIFVCLCGSRLTAWFSDSLLEQIYGHRVWAREEDREHNTHARAGIVEGETFYERLCPGVCYTIHAHGSRFNVLLTMSETTRAATDKSATDSMHEICDVYLKLVHASVVFIPVSMACLAEQDTVVWRARGGTDNHPVYCYERYNCRNVKASVKRSFALQFLCCITLFVWVRHVRVRHV